MFIIQYTNPSKQKSREKNLASYSVPCQIQYNQVCGSVKTDMILYFYTSLTEINNANACLSRGFRSFTLQSKGYICIYVYIYIKFQKQWIFPILLWKNFKHTETLYILHQNWTIVNDSPYLISLCAFFPDNLMLHVSWHFTTSTSACIS